MKRFDKSDYEFLKSVALAGLTTAVLFKCIPFTFDSFGQAAFTFVSETFLFTWIFVNLDCFFERKEKRNVV